MTANGPNHLRTNGVPDTSEGVNQELLPKVMGNLLPERNRGGAGGGTTPTGDTTNGTRREMLERWQAGGDIEGAK
jgi:hypothetical protein